MGEQGGDIAEGGLRHALEPETVEIDAAVLIGQRHDGPHRTDYGHGHAQSHGPQQASPAAAKLFDQLQRIGVAGHEEDANIGRPHIGEGQAGQSGRAQGAGAQPGDDKIGRRQWGSDH